MEVHVARHINNSTANLVTINNEESLVVQSVHKGINAVDIKNPHGIVILVECKDIKGNYFSIETEEVTIQDESF